ncbi:sigma-70 family RNA polymerase sigma factor [Candidatus Poribacteria bacterium]|nr:sigma-70 family RNA polymerase sigma factor [Candidatus Poribacteria bacterium]
MKDEELVNLTLQGKVEAFSVLVMRYQSSIYGLCYHFLKDFEEAKDITQEVFIRAYTRLSELKEPEKFKAWLKQIAVNLCRMHLRSKASSQRRVKEVISSDSFEARNIPDSLPRPDEALEREEMEEMVKKALSKLSPRNQQILILFYIDDLSYRDIAEFLDLPLSTVKWRLHRSRKLLREEVLKMMEKGFSEHKVGSEFTQEVYQAICEKVEEPFELDLVTRPGEPIVIFAGLGQMKFRMTGWDEERVALRGKKVLFGGSVEDARRKSDQVQTFLRRCDSFLKEGFGRDMEIVTGATGLEPTLEYTTMGEMLRRLLEWTKEKWSELHRDVIRKLEGSCVSVELLGNRPEPMWAHIDEELKPLFSVQLIQDDLALGPSVSLDISLSVPNGHPVVIFLVFTRYPEISNFEGEITLIGDSVISKAYDIKGKLRSFRGFIEEIKGFQGELSILDDGYYRGVEWGKDVVRRVGHVPVMKIEDVNGKVELKLKEEKVRMKKVFGEVRCRNEFGDTEFEIEEIREGDRYELSSTGGDITVKIADSLKGKVKIVLESESGKLDYKRWEEFEYTFNNPWLIRAGSVPKEESEEADLRVRTAIGTITLRPISPAL